MWARRDIALLSAFLGKALIERTKIDDNSLVGSAADLLFRRLPTL
jgi:hypothetical protein